MFIFCTVACNINQQADAFGVFRFINVVFTFSSRKGIRKFPKPYRGMERRSVSDEETYDENPTKKQAMVRAKIVNNYRLHLFSSLESDAKLAGDDLLIETPSYDEFTDVASSRMRVEAKDERVEAKDERVEAKDEGIVVKKRDFLESWLKRLHFVTLPVHQFGNWIPLVTSRWYCSGHGCGLDQVSFEGKTGQSCICAGLFL